MAIQLLIFDLDGTLIDSAPDIILAMRLLLQERQLPDVPDASIRQAIGEGVHGLIHNLFGEQAKDPTFLQGLEADFLRLFDAHLLEKTALYPGVSEFLDSCEQQIAIVTNKIERQARRTVAELPLHRHSWVRILGADSLARRKPDPLPLFEVMRAAGVQAHETLMIGDGLPDIMAAQAAGVRSIAIGFGYGRLDKLMALGANRSLGHFSELSQMIREMSETTP